jgi:hypothetical protein
MLTNFLGCRLVAYVLLSGCVNLIFESSNHLFDASNVTAVPEVANVEYPVGDECDGCDDVCDVFKVF